MNVDDLGFLRDTIGMPVAHKNAFIQVAKELKTIIMVRATGPTCHGLLEEGYDTKGYRIHGKSCTWGPMAGFVMRDPRLNKYGMKKANFNQEKHTEAIVMDHENQGWKASTTPLKISQDRVNWLIQKHYLNNFKMAPDGRIEGTASHETGILFHYTLIRDIHGLWGVYFDYTKRGSTFHQIRGTAPNGKGQVGRLSAIYHDFQRRGTSYEAMLAMTNPPDHRKFKTENYRNAITGDYDLFALWSYKKGTGRYNPYGLDYRPLGTVRGATKDESKNIERLEEHFTEIGRTKAETVDTNYTSKEKWQGTKLGNITERIYLACQLINSIVGTQVLWHSDEAARPFLDDVDLPIIAFTPTGNFHGIENIQDFKNWIAICEALGFQITLSNAWTLTPDEKKKNRLGSDYEKYVPKDTYRTIVPDWYNR